MALLDRGGWYLHTVQPFTLGPLYVRRICPLPRSREEIVS